MLQTHVKNDIYNKYCLIHNTRLLIAVILFILFIYSFIYFHLFIDLFNNFLIAKDRRLFMQTGMTLTMQADPSLLCAQISLCTRTLFA